MGSSPFSLRQVGRSGGRRGGTRRFFSLSGESAAGESAAEKPAAPPHSQRKPDETLRKSNTRLVIPLMHSLWNTKLTHSEYNAKILAYPKNTSY